MADTIWNRVKARLVELTVEVQDTNPNEEEWGLRFENNSLTVTFFDSNGQPGEKLVIERKGAKLENVSYDGKSLW